MSDKPNYATWSDFYAQFDYDTFRSEREILDGLEKQGMDIGHLTRRAVVLAKWELEDGYLEATIIEHTIPTREYRRKPNAPEELPVDLLPGFDSKF